MDKMNRFPIAVWYN